TARQFYTFTRTKYLLDFSNVERINSFNIDDIEFLGNGRANGIMLPPLGIAWGVRDCWFSRPRTRAITSIGRACQGISIDRNQFIASDDDLLVPDRNSIAFNINANDSKIRNNRCVQFKHFAIFNGSGNLIVGNHFWVLDSDADGDKSAGIVFTQANAKSTVTGNYIDNMSIEMANEHSPNGETRSAGFGKLTISGNIFTAQLVPDRFTFLRIRPRGNGWVMNGITVTDNTFKMFNGAFLDRIDEYDNSFGSLNHAETRDVIFTGNSFDRVRQKAESPVTVAHTQNSANATWTVNLSEFMPFACEALGVDGIVPQGQIVNSGGSGVFDQPWVNTRVGADANQVQLRWSTATTGTVHLRARCDLAKG
ncbi:MAG: right-handed parallel beta-helix repeat-containing protein, partial [Pseudomonadota bacterium]